jgi:hypothetical protein
MFQYSRKIFFFFSIFSIQNNFDNFCFYNEQFYQYALCICFYNRQFYQYTLCSNTIFNIITVEIYNISFIYFIYYVSKKLDFIIYNSINIHSVIYTIFYIITLNTLLFDTYFLYKQITFPNHLPLLVMYLILIGLNKPLDKQEKVEETVCLGCRAR